MNLGDDATDSFDPAELSLADKWILTKLRTTISEVTKNLDAFELNIAAEKIYDFIWGSFCDWYIEMAKPSLYSDNAEEKKRVSAVLLKVLSTSMQLLHPFMPFITEELYQRLPNHSETIMRTDWPKESDIPSFEREAEAMESLMDAVRAIRNLRAERKVPIAQKIAVRLVVADPASFSGAEQLLMRLVGADSITMSDVRGEIAKTDIHLVCEGAEAFIPLASLVDLDEERARLEKEIERMRGEVARADAKLSNEKFISRAPEASRPGLIHRKRIPIRSGSAYYRSEYGSTRYYRRKLLRRMEVYAHRMPRHYHRRRCAAVVL